MRIGFELAESMNGTFHRFDDPLTDRALRVSLRLVVDGLGRFARDRRVLAEGVLFAEDLADDGGAGQPVRGTLSWKLLDENRVHYALTFRGDDGCTYHLCGQRDFLLHNAIGSLTTMAASLYDDEKREIGRAVVEFVPRMELPALFRSFRPRLRRSSVEGS